VLSVETISGMGVKGLKENGVEGKFNYDIFDTL
jgi:hypothetical protein